MAVSKKVRFEVFKRDKFTCQYCGQRPPDVVLEVDHILPKVEGGKDGKTNLTTACFACNRGKAGNALDDVAPALDELQVLESIQEMLERRMTLKAEVEVARAEREVKDEAIEGLGDLWASQIGEGFRDASVRTHFIDKLEFAELQHAIDVTSLWRENNPWKSEHALWKYFCGVCWTMIREKEKVGA